MSNPVPVSIQLVGPQIVLPNIAIVGPSGSGKTSCLRNLNPETTAILNIERKQLPFRDAKRFKYNIMCQSAADVTTQLLMGVGMDSAIETVVIESFQTYDEFVLAQCRQNQKGYDIYSGHNKSIRDFINTTKNLGEPRSKGAKFVVFICLDEIVNIALPNGGNRSVRRIKVEGKELTGTIEKEFTIVLFTEAVEVNIGGSSRIEYKFQTNTDGITSAKTPMGMFSERYIENDLNKVIQEIKKYYGI